jgi:hypothetical protein
MMTSGRASTALHLIGMSIVLTLLAVTACGDEKVRTSTRHPPEGELVQTTDLPPVILIGDLIPLGFDTAQLYQIEPHFATLNTALVTLAQLKRSYDATTDESLRRRLNAYAIPFHLTADTHQRAVLRLIGPPLDTAFDNYVEGRKDDAGLADWHADHRGEQPGRELPGLVPPTTTRH